MPASPSPIVDVVLAVHQPTRPVGRAVRSVLGGTRADVRVTVVAHGLDPEVLAPQLDEFADDQRLRILRFDDGVPSPAGPFNRGLDLATASFTSVMGSDDVLDPGAVDSWLRTSRHDGADVVVARVRHGGGGVVRTPPVRPLRTKRLDGVKDRLAYRSAPLGLVSRARFGDLRFTTGAAVGEDIAYVNALWFSGARISLARGPAYVVMDDAPDRVTLAPKPMAEELAFLPTVLDGLRAAGSTQVSAYATKFLRVQVFGAVFNRPGADQWPAGEREVLAAACRDVLALAPRAVDPLSRADRSLLDAVLDTSVSASTLVERGLARRRFGRPETLLPRRPTALLHREAPLRFMAASLLAGR
ncbi:glycosyltransferase family A protein [Oerskovia sp. Root22]|uniref:glycosyltransferase family A protein n=1 Tax=Oerskovia sp. Root22 TaxID=1736494 RepID=UPI0009E836DC|nr:glycosyltransferase family A protein [Oerskovia sp. Root22]